MTTYISTLQVISAVRGSHGGPSTGQQHQAMDRSAARWLHTDACGPAGQTMLQAAAWLLHGYPDT